MRVAIQIYGHLRSFRETHRSLFENVIDFNRQFGIEFDVFLHTWDEFDALKKSPTGFNRNEHYAGLKLTQLERAEVANAYSPKKILFESQSELSPAQAEAVVKSGGDLSLATAFKNVCHSFCAANELRRQQELLLDTQYDLVLITRPDIVFYRKLFLTAFRDKQHCWQYFSNAELDKYVFSTYINGVHSVVHPKKYIAGLDLVLMAKPVVCNRLAEWESNFGEMLNTWPEYALLEMMNKQGLEHSYFVYEKDKSWTILRVGAHEPDLFSRLVDRLYGLAVPLLLRSRRFAQHTYTNVTTMVNRSEYETYLTNHLSIFHESPTLRLRRKLRRLFSRTNY